jgi:hypothetical protein
MAEMADQPAPGHLVSFSMIHRCATRPDPAHDGPIRERIAGNLHFRRIYNDLVRKHSLAFIADRAAASSDGDLALTIDGYKLEIEHSKKAPERAYIYITVPAGRKAPRFLEVLPAAEGDDDPAAQLLPPEPLPEAKDGLIQLIRGTEDPLVKALKRWQQNIALH